MKVLLHGRASYMTAADAVTQRELLESIGAQVVEAEGEDAPRDADVLVVHSALRVDAALLERLGRPRLVIASTSGHDHVDLAAARAVGARVARCPLARRDAVVETSIAMGLSLLRAVPALHDRARAGAWDRPRLAEHGMRRLLGLPVGVVGCGVIGARAAELWEALGARVLRCDPVLPDGLPIDDVVRRAGLLTLHCSLTESSRNIIDARRLAAMPPGAVLVNTARGGCVDIDALLAADHLGGIGLDVFPQEPWPGLAELARRPGVLLTPHAAGYFEGLGAAVAREVADTVAAFAADGSIPHEIVG